MLEHPPSKIIAPSAILARSEGYVDFWYISPDDELVLCRYEEALPACFDNMNGAIFVRGEGGWRYRESFDVVCNIDR